MKVGVNIASHGLNFGGGWKASLWHIRALKALNFDVTVFVTSRISRENAAQLQGVPIRFYTPNIESQFDGFLTLNHFGYAVPSAKKFNWQHVFFPMYDNAPPEGLSLAANSEYTARHIKNKWGRDAKVVYIPIETHYHSGSKSNTIVHVSRLSEPNTWADKSHRQMIQAFKLISRRLPGWRLVIAGAVEDGQDFYAEELMRSAAKYPIEFLQSPSDEDLISLYANSSIMWHATGVSLPTISSAQEHMGIVPIEAQASGCVPICYNSGGIPEMVLNGRTGLLFDNIQDLPGMTIGLLEHMDQWAQLSQAGQVWATKRADFGAFVQRVDDMLNDRPITPIPDFKMELKNSPSDVTIVIPTYNSLLLNKCLLSLNKTAPNAKVLIMNNGDTLSLAQEVDITNIQVVDLGENLGFSGALRKAESLVQTPFVMMFNDDIEATHDRWMEYMMLPFNSGAVGIVGAKLLFPDVRLQHAGGSLDWNRPDIGFHRNYGGVDGVEYSTAQEVDFVTGACMLMRRELFHMPDELLGGLNFEELWISMYAKEKGFSTIYQPAAVLVHDEGNTKKRTPEAQEKADRNKRAFTERWRK